MLTIYPQAKASWIDYINNGFSYLSKGTFIEDYIEFFKQKDMDSYIECFVSFYKGNYKLLQTLNHKIKMTESEANEFFEYSPTIIQKAFVDFCYKSIEQHIFQSESIWIEPEEQYIQPAPQHSINNNIIDLTEDTDDEMPELENSETHLSINNQLILNEIKSQLYDEATDDEMPPLEDIDDTALYEEDSDSSSDEDNYESVS